MEKLPTGGFKNTAKEIFAALSETTGETLTDNDIHRLRIRMSEELKSAKELAQQRLVWTEEISKALDLPEDKQRILEEAVDLAILGNKGELTDVAPEKLLRIQVAHQRLKLQERKIENAEERLKLDNQKLQLEIDKLERQVAQQRTEEEARKKAAERAISKAEKKATSDPEKAALNAIRKSLGIEKPEAA